MASGIYQIKCMINDMAYVGSTTNILRRWYMHKWMLNRGEHYNPGLQIDWNKYGEDKFAFEIIMECNKKHLLKFEQWFIDFKPGYNICERAGCRVTPTSGGGMQGKTHTEETKKKMSITHKERPRKPHPEETKRKIRESNKVTWERNHPKE